MKVHLRVRKHLAGRAYDFVEGACVAWVFLGTYVVLLIGFRLLFRFDFCRSIWVTLWVCVDGCHLELVKYSLALFIIV